MFPVLLNLRVPTNGPQIQKHFLRAVGSTFKPKTTPIDESSKVLKHLHFTKTMDFEKGLDIQEKFVAAQLDMKKLKAKIKRKIFEVEQNHNGAPLNVFERSMLDNILTMKPNPTILTFEFWPVYSGGKRIKKTITDKQIKKYEEFVPTSEIDNPAPKFVQTERGGQITFHGPGQIVAYIILDLKTFNKFSVKDHVSAIQGAVSNSMLKINKEDGNPLALETKTNCDTGVWTTKDEKLASIGIHVRRSITSHGVCINVDPDLSYLNNFEMCGLPNKKATSIYQERPGTDLSVQDVAKSFVNEYAKILDIDTVERIDLDNIEID
ncbi:hypothetical protein TPHA_0C02280 [Tetrapisispora phaffii CBS 4417]|uniref:Octanoyltransferase n=1 Tax=Tetrapisispora phaffii (strain ATCC 24235 / CBS 4417 / NBRC 1672 / NRRL Y-8282 / UCD 70-5) TaxID=1071381 RepID=G8BRK5_TETPH|nr:hypothetical protein TPHA_0C02280 [Tetrapisispora phaffii CBS 4417]CCE62381.1 hypothetical protein TPHA_0C02280 [Tetrapisispora phaffii CBS 4417]